VRIAQLIETDGPGGAERIVVELARTLVESGHQAVVFVPENGEGWIDGQLRGSAVQLERFRLDRTLDPGLAHRLAAAFRAHGIQVAHSHEFSMAVYGAWAAWGAGIPHVFTMHGGRYHAAALRRRVALRAASRASRATIAVSETVGHQLAHDLWTPRNRITVIPNGVRLPQTASTTLRDELGLQPGERLVLAVGNLYPVKGHRYLVEALALLRSGGHRVRVAIAGRGGEERRLMDLARELGVGEQLHLLGLRADIGNLLAGADLFALPSLSEGLPLALLEAMLAGCAIVAADVGEIRAVLADGDAGHLVRPGDATLLARALGSLLAHPAGARALGARARHRASAEYTIDRMAGRYATLYRGLRSSRGTNSMPGAAEATPPASAAPRATAGSGSAA